MTAVGATLGGKYVLQAELGRGGMGAVYAAVNTWTGRAVAVKTLHAEAARSQQVLDRFWQEGRATSKLHHPNVIDVLDMGWDDASGEPFLVQEYLEGQSLEQHIKRAPGGRLSPEEALALLLPVAGALLACHRGGILHRDVKPANILVTVAPDGTVCPKLIDFGISKDLLPDPDAASHTATGVPMGSPAYMSPEQARGDREIDARTDVWAFGATLFEALTGRRPFVGPTVAVVLAKVIYEPPPRLAATAPDVPADLAAVVDAALQHERDRRVASMDDLATALLACESARGEAVRSTPGFARLLSDLFHESASGERVRAMIVGAPAAPAPTASTANAWSTGAPPPPSPPLRTSAFLAAGLLGVAILVGAVAFVLYPRGAPAPTAVPPTAEAAAPLVPSPDAAVAVAPTADASVDAAADASPPRAAAQRSVRAAPTPSAPTPLPRPRGARVRDPLAPDDDPYEVQR